MNNSKISRSNHAESKVRRRRGITISESLNVLKTGRYEARVKGGMATDPPEADRQWEEWNLNKAQISTRSRRLE